MCVHACMCGRPPSRPGVSGYYAYPSPQCRGLQCQVQVPAISHFLCAPHVCQSAGVFACCALGARTAPRPVVLGKPWARHVKTSWQFQSTSPQLMLWACYCLLAPKLLCVEQLIPGAHGAGKQRTDRAPELLPPDSNKETRPLLGMSPALEIMSPHTW